MVDVISPTIHLVQILEEKIRWDGREAMRFFRFQNSDSSFRKYATNAILEEQKQIHTVTCKSEIENHYREGETS